MIAYLSCDWGTSSFRLQLVDAESFAVIDSVLTKQGILATYNKWQEENDLTDTVRSLFYLNVIDNQVRSMEEKLKHSLAGVPLLISGMASSSIGIKSLPYHQIPFFTDGHGMLSAFIPKTPSFDHDVLLISGVKSDDDVMRGEETQLIGLLSQNTGSSGHKLYILPGTHSKHILVKDNIAVSFKTYMTGEFFDLLSKKSILHAGLEEGNDFQSGNAKENFKAAVQEGSTSGLLHVCFKVRTNSLFEKLSKKENYHYLSGLLIGAELGEIDNNDTIGIYLCCGNHLKLQYEMALEVLGLKEKLHSFPVEVVEKAALIGQYRIYEKYINR